MALPSVKPRLLFDTMVRVDSTFTMDAIYVALTKFPSASGTTLAVTARTCSCNLVHFRVNCTYTVAIMLFKVVIFTGDFVRGVVTGCTSYWKEFK